MHAIKIKFFEIKEATTALEKSYRSQKYIAERVRIPDLFSDRQKGN